MSENDENVASGPGRVRKESRRYSCVDGCPCRIRKVSINVEADEHAEWLALAKAAGLTIEEWLVATVRAVRAVER